MPTTAAEFSPADFQLASYNPEDTHGKTEAECTRRFDENRIRIAELQNVLYAERKQSLLVVLQAMDTGGKDPIIRDVLSAANPQACRVTAFKRTSSSERRRDRLWRFHQHVPADGEIGVFNRSYYDEIIADDAHDELDDQERAKRYEQIRCFEWMLAADNVTIIKLFLHISKEEQRRRLEERISDPSRHWELSESDFAERKFWDGYMRAYEAAIRHTHTDYAPWHVVTSDRKWFRDAAASMLILEALQRMNPQYPPPKVDLNHIEWF